MALTKKKGSVITIDGPAGSGKSTIAKILAEELGYYQLDSGALYRAAAYLALKFAEKSDSSVEQALEEAEFQKGLEAVSLKIVFEDKKQKLYLAQKSMEAEIRLPEITKNIKPIADSLFVRNWVNQRLYDSVHDHDVVVDGRDMGTVVFPHAQRKFYLTAGLEERARRRFDELKEKGVETNIETVTEEIRQRDHEDENRKFGALKKAKEAVVIDTTKMTQKEVIDKIKEEIQNQRKSEIRVKKVPQKTKTLSFQEEEITMESLLPGELLNVSDLRKGNVIKTKVIRIEPPKKPEYALVDLNSKSEGIIFIDEFEVIPQIGDEIEAIVQSFDSETGFVQLSKKALEIQQGIDLLEEAHRNQFPVMGEIKKKLARGYIVDVEKIEMFLPHSQIGSLLQEKSAKSHKGLLGHTFSYKILQLDTKRATGVLSRKAWQDEQNKSNWEELIKKVEIGDIVEGKVLHYARIGVFIMVEQIIGFLHRSNVSWGRQKQKMEETYPPESGIRVRVLEIDSENMKLSLGLKQLQEDPWENILDKISVGSTVEGDVGYIAKYGAFVDLDSQVTGFIPASEMSWTRKPEHTKDIMSIGERVKTKVLAINLKDKKITLGLKQLQENPWNQVMETVKLGSVRKGKIKGVASYGIFVQITNAIDGLIRKEDISWKDRMIDPGEKYKKNQEIEFQIINIDEEGHRIACSIKHLESNPYKEVKKKYANRALFEGEIIKFTKFGILVQLPEGLSGLVHFSEIPRGQEQILKQNLKKGDKIKVVLKNVDTKNERISLSLKGVEHALEKMEIGKYVEKNDQTLTSNPFGNLKELVNEK